MSKNTQNQHLNITLNTNALQAKYAVDLQRLLDILSLISASVSTVSENSYQDFHFFMTFNPAEGRKLDFHTVKSETQNWLIRSILGDTIDITNAFLDECRAVCAVIRLHTLNFPKGKDFNRIFDEERKKFHRLGLPDKLDALSSEFDVSSSFVLHLLSLNRVRNCLVHRLGIVGDRDIDDTGRLLITWRTLEILATSPDGTQEILVNQSGIHIQEGWIVSIRSTEHTKSFNLGERIEFTSLELFGSIFTLFSFAQTLVSSINDYTLSLDIPNKQANETNSGSPETNLM